MSIRQYIVEVSKGSYKERQLKQKMIAYARRKYGRITILKKYGGFTYDNKGELILWYNDKFGSTGIVKQDEVE